MSRHVAGVATDKTYALRNFVLVVTVKTIQEEATAVRIGAEALRRVLLAVMDRSSADLTFQYSLPRLKTASAVASTKPLTEPHKASYKGCDCYNVLLQYLSQSYAVEDRDELGAAETLKTAMGQVQELGRVKEEHIRSAGGAIENLNEDIMTNSHDAEGSAYESDSGAESDDSIGSCETVTPSSSVQSVKRYR